MRYKQPFQVFAFANVEDYEVLSKILADPANKESAASFFPTQFAKGGDAKLRAQLTLQIIGRIRSPALPAAYQLAPIHPAENHYFSGAPFLYGKDRAAKFRVKTTEAPSGTPNAAEPNYLRAGLIKRLAPGTKPIELVFQVQLRTLESLKADVGGLNTQIENFCTEWSDAADKYPFVDVAKITIPAQEFDTPEQRAACERLAFTPWNSLEAHRPIGGINRMRKSVYEASAGFRHPMK